MSKKISYIVLFLVSLVLYFIQQNLFTNLKIFGVMPQILIYYVLFIGLFTGRKSGLVLGGIIGLLLDFFTGNIIGISAILFMAIGYLGGVFDKSFDKEILISILIMVIISTSFYETFRFLFICIVNKLDFETADFLKTIFIENLYNCLLTIIVFPIMQKFGYILENIFKPRKITTKYF